MKTLQREHLGSLLSNAMNQKGSIDYAALMPDKTEKMRGSLYKINRKLDQWIKYFIFDPIFSYLMIRKPPTKTNIDLGLFFFSYQPKFPYSKNSDKLTFEICIS